MSINVKLRKLYEEKWIILENKAKEIAEISHPLLIKVDEEKFTNSDIKILIFGQETDGWFDKFPNKNIDEIMNEYHQYLTYSNDKDRRPFWNNISKIGKTTRGEPTGAIRNIENKYFNIIVPEIEILKPDIIIFTTGYKRDWYFEEKLGKVKFIHPRLVFSDANNEGVITERMVSKVQLEKFPNIIAVRTEHPNRRTLEKQIILDTIIEMIETQM